MAFNKLHINNLALIGFASSMAANHWGCALGPWQLYYATEYTLDSKLPIYWQRMIYGTSKNNKLDVLPDLVPLLEQLSQTVLRLTQQSQAWCVLGGDHSSAMGTWSGAAVAKRSEGPIGLLWLDAHMDAHTPASSHSKNVHGMPLAHLLGYGDERLSRLLDDEPKLNPENVCLVGLRSYEQEEIDFLQKLGVKYYLMQDILKFGLNAILQNALDHVSKYTCGYGISIDLDVFDPSEMPAVSCPEPAGISLLDFVSSLPCLIFSKPCIGIEIAEFNPIIDKTEKVKTKIFQLIEQLSMKVFI